MMLWAMEVHDTAAYQRYNKYHHFDSNLQGSRPILPTLQRYQPLPIGTDPMFAPSAAFKPK